MEVFFHIFSPPFFQFIENEMSNLGWTIEEDKFAQDTIIGNVEFTNVIATLDPNAPRRMVIACMYQLDYLNVWCGINSTPQ